MAEQVDARDLKSLGALSLYGFNSRSWHQNTSNAKTVYRIFPAAFSPHAPCRLKAPFLRVLQGLKLPALVGALAGKAILGKGLQKRAAENKIQHSQIKPGFLHNKLPYSHVR